jgi:hypothetical protein
MCVGARLQTRYAGMTTLMALAGCLASGRLAAQTEYFNTDGGRPLRVEDATPTARFALDLHFPTARVERFDGGVGRLRVEPALSYGFLPRTAVELRAAFVYREPEASPRGGMTGIGFGITHALNTETTRLPGIAIAGELYQPTGSAKTGGAAYSLRSLITRTTRVARVHANATFGSYNVTVPQQTIEVCGQNGLFPQVGLQCAGDGGVPPFIPDGPCMVAPGDSLPVVAGLCESHERRAAAPTAAVEATTNTTLRGSHWVVGLGADRAFALHSVLVMADLFGERYVGLFDRWDWTAELGARHQLSPSLTIDAAVGRRFAGVTRAWVITAGLTRTSPFAVHGRHRP